MLIRVIRKPEYTSLHHVQIKRWWWPFWTTITYDNKIRCLEIADNLLKKNTAFDVVFEGETK